MIHQNVTLQINNKTVSVSSNLTILAACKLFNIQIPSFCFHDRLLVAGNCRICLVEIFGSPKLEVSCTKLVSSGIVVLTSSVAVQKARESVLEFILKNHPLDCPVCDQGGECDLQDFSYGFGGASSRYFSSKVSVKFKSWGPLVATLITRCIFCTRCVRLSTQTIGFSSFGVLGRGELSEIHIFSERKLRSVYSGNLIDLCPVVFLTNKVYV